MRLEALLNSCLDPSGSFYISTTQEISENIRRIGMTDPTDSEDESPGEHPDVQRYNPVERGIVTVLLSKLRLSHHLLMEKGYGNDTVKYFWNSLLAFCSYWLDDVNVLTSTAANQTQMLHMGIPVIDYETGKEIIITGVRIAYWIRWGRRAWYNVQLASVPSYMSVRGFNDIRSGSITMADNLPRGRTAIRCYPDLGVIWNVWQYSSLVAAIKVS